MDFRERRFIAKRHFNNSTQLCLGYTLYDIFFTNFQSLSQLYFYLTSTIKLVPKTAITN